MEFFDRKEEVLDLELTQYGKYLLSIGKLKPAYYAFYDDDINYDTQYQGDPPALDHTAVSSGPTENQKDTESRIKETPRIKVPKGSVGITEQFTNIYTFESPGGWNIIGNTPLKIFDKLNLEEPVLIKPGDKVSFYQISKEEYIGWDE